MCLAERGLLVRYFIDDAPGGQSPFMLADSVNPPLDLLMIYDPELEFIEYPSGRALEWKAAGTDGHAFASADGSKLYDGLDGAQQATLEVVATVFDVVAEGSRIIHIGNGNEEGRLTLRSAAPGDLQLQVNNALSGVWDVGQSLVTRSVLHVVLDTNAIDPAERARLYVDGEVVLPSKAPVIEQGHSIALGFDRYFVLGNREVGGRSFMGELHYAAIYGVALSENEVAGNTELLAEFDDAP